jgi:replicative DNA helicase
MEEMILDKQLPQSIQVEGEVLGVLIKHPDFMGSTVGLNVNLFYDPRHQRIFEIMQEMYVESGFYTYASVLGKSEDKLKSLVDEYEKAYFTSTQYEFHISELIKQRNRRTLLQKISKLLNKIYELEPMDVVNNSIMDLLNSESETRRDKTFREITLSFVEKLDEKEKTQETIKTGIHVLDNKTGGFRPGQFVVIAGPTGHGKTALALQVVVNECFKHNKSMAYVSLEMPENEITARLYAQAGKIGLWNLIYNQKTESESKTFNQLTNEYSDRPLCLEDKPALSLYDIMAKLRRWKLKYGISCAIIDYLELMKYPDGEREDLRIASVVFGLKSLAKELDIPIVLLCQLSRTSAREKRKPMLSDIKNSSAIEQAADMVIFVYQPERDEVVSLTSTDPAIISLAKHRNGPTGEMPVEFVKNSVYFREINRDLVE